jgi:hypothetical protein
MRFCDNFADFYNTYLDLFISFIGSILNILCIIGFLNIKEIRHQRKTNVFRYLLAKSVVDSYTLLRNLIFSSVFCPVVDCFLTRYYVSCNISLVFNNYIGRISLLMSILLELAANFNRYRIITNKFIFLNKISIYFKFLLIILYCFSFYVYIFFQENCLIPDQSLNETMSYYIYVTNFTNTELGIGLKFMHTFIRDVICIILIMVLNIFTLIFMRQSFKRKRELAFNPQSSQSANKNDQNRKLEKSENNLTYLVLTSSLINILGHIILFINMLPINSIKSDSCFNSIAPFLLYFSYSINFFVYYFFNKHFKSYFKTNLIKIFSFITFNIFN